LPTGAISGCWRQLVFGVNSWRNRNDYRLKRGHLSSADALYAVLADYCLCDDSKAEVPRKMINIDCCDDSQWSTGHLTERLTAIEVEQGVVLPEASLKDPHTCIDKVCGLAISAAVVKKSVISEAIATGFSAQCRD
jgi:hypothetical protein